MSVFLHSTSTLTCSFETKSDIVGLLDKTSNTSLIVFLIHKRLRNFSYICHSRLTVLFVVRYQSSRCLINDSYFHDCVSNVMVVSKKANFALLPVIPVVSSLIHHNVISS